MLFFNWFVTAHKKIVDKNSFRTIELYQNILYSFVIKFGIAAIGLLLVPLNLSYLTQSEYGVWLTVASINNWLYVFDIGLGNGLRNKFTYSVSKNEHLQAKIYLSTTYAIIFIIIVILLILFYGMHSFLNWNHFFNANIDAYKLNMLVQLTFIMLCFKLLFSVLTTALIAYHKVRISNLIEFIASTVVLIITYFVVHYTKPSILLIGVINTVIPVFVLFVANFFVYSSTLKAYKPSLKFVQLNLWKQLFNKGIQFFIIQLASLMMLVVNQLLIARFFSSSDVTVYTIVSKYFSIPLLGFAIVIIPFWSSFSEAYIKEDYTWINSMIVKLIKLWCLTGFGMVLMILIFPYILTIWIAQPLQFNDSLIIYFAIFVMLNSWAGLFNQFNNALDKLRIQLFGALFMLVFHIPISYLLCNYFEMRLEGILLSACICQLPAAILSSVQYHLIYKQTAKGIWLK